MTRINFKLSAAVIVLLLSSGLKAQTNLSLKAAIDTALLNNLGIQISKNNAEIADNNLSPAAAGMLPLVVASGSTSYGEANQRQETAAGIVTERNGVTTRNQTGRADAYWTIFDGAKMFATYKKLQALQDLGEIQVKAQINNTIAAVSQSYFELVRQQQLLSKTQSTFNLYDERMRLADRKLNIGSSPRTELLQATIDYNAQVSMIEQQKINLNAARIQLNNLLMHSVDDTLLFATDSLVNDSMPDYGQLLSKIETGNLDLQQQMILQEVAKHELSEIRAGYFPTLDLNAAYSYNRNVTTQGILLENRSYGPSIGLSASWNIFNGNLQRKAVRNAKLQQENAKYNAELIKQSAQSSLASAWQNYNGAKVILKNESESEKLALQNLDIMIKRFRLGESNVLELREAQQSLEEVQIRLSNANYNVNIAAMQLKQLTGLLVP